LRQVRRIAAIYPVESDPIQAAQLAHGILVGIVLPHFPIVEDRVGDAQRFGQLLVVEAALALDDFGDLREIFTGHSTVLQFVHVKSSVTSFETPCGQD
jgi:hypothetical protein